VTLAPAALGAFAATSKTSSSSSYSFLIIIALFAAAYFLFLRPQSQRAKRQREQQRNFAVGDEVLTAGGIVGRVIDEQGDRITVETSVGASFTVLRQYIVRRIEEAEPQFAEEDGAAAGEGDGATDHGQDGGDEEGGDEEGGDGGGGGDSGDENSHDDSGSTGT
jgi:preprotein translocase subunit YajC